MKTYLNFIIAAFVFLVAVACQNNSNIKEGVITDSSATHSFEIYRAGCVGEDTCNRLDVVGRRQGKWYLYDKTPPKKIIDTVFYKNGVVVQTQD